MKAEVYSRNNCPYCVKAKMLLQNRKVPFVELDATELREQLIERVTNDTGAAPRSVPQIYIGDEYVGGYDQLVEYFAKFDAANG